MEAVTAQQPAPYRWKILGLTVGGQAATAALFQGLPSIGPILAESYGLTLGQVGLALGAVGFGMTLTLLPWGVAADRFGERRIIPLGLAGTAVTLAVVAATSGYVALTVGLFLAGLWAASANAAGGRAVMGWFGPSERGTALGIRGASVPLGGGLAALTLPLIADASGPRASILALGLLTLTAAATTMVWLRDPPAKGSAPNPAFVPRAVLADRALWRLVVVTFLLVATQYAFVGFLALFLSDARGVAPATAGLALVAVHVLSAVSRVAAGRWSDLTGSRIRPLRIIAAVAVVGFVALGLVADAPAGVLVPVLFVAALAGVSWNALTFAASAEMAPPGAAGTAIGLQNTALGLGAALYLPLFALLVEATSWNAGFALVALAPLTALVLLRKLPA